MVNPTGDSDDSHIIPALPVNYRGQQFRSTLEANWAATFDFLRWFWLYEPIAVQVDGHGYLIDFELPHQRVWAEVKGPRNVGVEKAYAVAEHFGANQGAEGPDGDPYDLQRPLMVILEPAGPGDALRWRAAHPDQHIVLVCCPECTHFGFMDYNGIWACRYGCHNGGANKFWLLKPCGMIYESGELNATFQRTWRRSL